jgi:hypothetical protein
LNLGSSDFDFPSFSTLEVGPGPYRTYENESTMAFFEPLASFLRNYSFSLLICGAVYYFVRNRYRAHLRKIPGPFLASMTDLWAVFYSLKNDAYRDYALHRKYDSPLLRLGPNTVAVSDPEAIRVIYGYKRVFPKVCLTWPCSTGTKKLTGFRVDCISRRHKRPREENSCRTWRQRWMSRYMLA